LDRGVSGQSYNVGSDYAVSIFELAEIISSVANIQHPQIRVLEKLNLSGEYERYVPDISKASKELHLNINIPLKNALERTFLWYQQSMESRKLWS
jgi:dTDP-glucose 4,6-dehydratase